MANGPKVETEEPGDRSEAGCVTPARYYPRSKIMPGKMEIATRRHEHYQLPLRNCSTDLGADLGSGSGPLVIYLNLFGRGLVKIVSRMSLSHRCDLEWMMIFICHTTVIYNVR